ncbi:MAG: DUF1738 domain-containing protein [Ignavibacteriales bacterium]|nr:DUF1738 domain-containing protein [Ignavibacteriales bacterium]
MNKSELYNRINNQILEKLNEGVIPWKKSWKEGIPSNLISRKAYHGINFLSLSLRDFASPYYLTFYQCKQRGGSIKSGEKSSMVVYYKLMDIAENENDRRVIPFIRYSNVFNLTQTDLDTAALDKPVILSCESILDNMITKPIIKNNISRCYYSVSEDYISLPRITDFNTSEEYYSSLFHEVIHWTGHKNRLNRPSISEFDNEQYCYEELIAETGASFLSALCGISPSVIDNQAAYINGWIKLSKEKELLFAQAAIDAQKAVSYILNESAI